jgi:predicted GNAT family N-acyltransferase
VAVTPRGDLLGCGQVKHHSDGSIELASIAVQESARGQGLAQAVIESLLSLELKRPIYLMCRTRLMTLYMKFGFRAIKFEEMPPYFRRISRAIWIINPKAHLGDRLLVMRLD